MSRLLERGTVTVKETDLAWAAGAVDGEGCISIRTQKGHKSQLPQYALCVSVGNTDPRMPLKLQAMFGGWCGIKGSTAPRRAIMEWRVFATHAAHVLAHMRRYMVIKGEQADIALAFAKTLKRTGGHTQEVHLARQDWVKRIAAMKHEAVG